LFFNQSFGSFEDLKSEARRVVEILESGSEVVVDGLDVLDVGLDIAGESVELSAHSSSSSPPIDAPMGILNILYFVKDFISDKVARDVDFTLGDLHLLMAHEFQTRDDLKALAAQLVQVKNDELKPSLNPVPDRFIEPLPLPTAEDLQNPLVVFCDGTGDYYEKETPTNVKVLHSLCVNAYPNWADGFLYFQGIGVGNQLDHIFAFSFPDKIKEIYFAVCERWTEHKDLVVFGFSRGAFVARAVCGLLCSCGVLQYSAALAQDVESARRARTDEVVDCYLQHNVQLEKEDKNKENTCLLDVPLRAGEAQNRHVKVRFLGLFDTVPGIPLQQQRRFHHTAQHFSGTVQTACHIQAAHTSFLFESVSLHDTKYNTSLESAPTDWSSADEVSSFLKAHRHIEFSMPGDHTNIGGGRESELQRLHSCFISNLSLRRMLLASPFHAIVSALDKDVNAPLFPVPQSELEIMADVKSKLDFREGLSPLEQIQVIAVNMVELLCMDKKVPLVKIGTERSTPLSKDEKDRLREQVHKNLDRFNVTGDLLKFLKALLNRS
jgi:hypothetical protein